MHLHYSGTHLLLHVSHALLTICKWPQSVVIISHAKNAKGLTSDRHIIMVSSYTTHVYLTDPQSTYIYSQDRQEMLVSIVHKAGAPPSITLGSMALEGGGGLLGRGGNNRGKAAHTTDIRDGRGIYGP